MSADYEAVDAFIAEHFVEDDPALVGIAPVRVGVPARETEAAATIRPLVGPHHRLGLAARGALW